MLSHSGNKNSASNCHERYSLQFLLNNFKNKIGEVFLYSNQHITRFCKVYGLGIVDESGVCYREPSVRNSMDLSVSFAG